MSHDTTEVKNNDKNEQDDSVKSRKKLNAKFVVLILVCVFLLVGLGGYGALYASTPTHIRTPQYQHYHMRTQIIVNGEQIDFSQGDFQEVYEKDVCSDDISDQPFHFHDNIDQMTHVHWDQMSGGEFLKYYGWNLIDGNDSSLGRRFDLGLVPKTVETKNILPSLPEGVNYYIYTGDETGYEQRLWDDFLRQDFETFFDKQSSINPPQDSSMNMIFPRASAHGEENDGHDSEVSEEDKIRLEKINNLLGNVVVFVQTEEPSDELITERFANLVPLSESTCGG